MIINKKLLFMLLFTVIFVSNAAVNDTGMTKNILLPDSTTLDLNEPVVTLIETNDYVIFAENATFLTELENQAEKFNPAKKLYSIFKEKTLTQTYNADSVITQGYYKEMLKFIIASLLSSGKCFLFSKSSDKLINTVTMKSFTTEYLFGRRYEVNGNIVLEVVDGNQ